MMPEVPSRLAERGGALLEGAAERSRTSMRTRFDRLRLAWRSLVQTAAAATVAYLIASELVGHTQPFFAPIAAIITLGITVGQRGRRAFELALGVAVGIAVADALVLLMGTGVATLAVVVFLAMGAAVFLGTGQIFANQAAVSAVLVAVLPASGGFSGARFVDALIGGGVALLANSLLLPADPVKLVKRAAEPVLEELARTLLAIADAIETHEEDAAERALLQARRLDELEADLQEAVTVSRETARFAPSRRRARGTVDFYAEASAQIDLAIRNVRVLARGALRGARLGENLPPAVADAVRDLAEAVLALREALEDPDRADAVRDARAARGRGRHPRARGDRQPLGHRGGRAGALDGGRPAARLRPHLRRGRGPRPRGRAGGGGRRGRVDVSWTLRRAGPDDAEAMAETLQIGFDGYRAFAPPGWLPPDARSAGEIARVRVRLLEPTTWALLAEDGGLVAGHAGYLPQPGAPGSAHLWQLFVRPPWWGSGVASALLEAALAAAPARGLSPHAPLHTARPGPRPRLLRARGLRRHRLGSVRGDDRPRTGRVRARAAVTWAACGGEVHWSASPPRWRCCSARPSPRLTGAATTRATCSPSTATGRC